MRVARFAVDEHLFNTITEARAFRNDPANGYDPEYPIRTALYESEAKREVGMESIDFEACGTDWETSEWTLERNRGEYIK